MPAPEPHELFAPGATTQGVLHGEAAFAQAVVRLLGRAAEAGAALTVVDADFARWPLSAPEALQAWQDWVMTHRSAQGRMLARDWSAVARQHGRWVRWHAPWGHRLQTLEMAPEDAPMWPGTLLVAAGVGGLKFAEESGQQVFWTTDRVQCRAWLATVDVILQRSTTVTPHSTFGL